MSDANAAAVNCRTLPTEKAEAPVASPREWKWRPYEIHVTGWPPFVRTARSRGSALYDAFLSFGEVNPDLRFGGFMKIANARACPVPEVDGYAWIRRNYDCDIRVGQRVTITGEGRDLEGKGATVVYPGESTNYVRLVIDGEDRISNVHPFSVRAANTETAAAGTTGFMVGNESSGPDAGPANVLDPVLPLPALLMRGES